ncbi:PREDICTED: kelch domain-containing protein 4-like [Branchiostoma belcheri]|uniref:Kelch domain-containing protein 4-like n=1 Tax=Branchiostoma belcheri TaxID=7741 RepID=A0A6P4ZCM1_BRABE|nr:PREDICTED: kelch domain-containing protein 4-like [Branchiostoma belcheri]
MGKKKDKKGKGAEKTALKTAKKAEKKARAEADEDLEALIAEFQELDRKRTQVTEEPCAPPLPRCNGSLVAHPEKEELILFGGEYYNGQKTFVYNDLFFYNIKKNEWSQVQIPEGPPPRCAHQAVSLAQGGGQMWVFGGEFASPSQSQFYHYKDLWVLHLATRKWEKISSSGGPTSRSGHRMVSVKRQLVVFGGFHDNIINYQYFCDLYTFNLDTYQWARLSTSGVGPSPRSACQLLPTPDGSVIVYGGYSKTKVKRDVDKGTVHSDMFVLSPEKGSTTEGGAPQKWKWAQVKASGVKPSPRCGFSSCLTAPNRAIFFGGVQDEEDEEELSGDFFDDSYTLDLENRKWFLTNLKGRKSSKRRRRRAKKDKEAGAESDEESEDDSRERGEEKSDSDSEEEESVPLVPSPRMNTLMVVKGKILFLYGGVYEEGDKQVTLNDLYALDLHKMDEWRALVTSNPQDQEWLEESSSDDDDDDDDDSHLGATGGKNTGSASGIVTLNDLYALDLHKMDEWRALVTSNPQDQEWLEESSSDDDDDDDDSHLGATGGKNTGSASDSDEGGLETKQDHPSVLAGENVADFFSRTKDHWMDLARKSAEEEAQSFSEKALKKIAFQMAKFFHEEQAKTSEDESQEGGH